MQSTGGLYPRQILLSVLKWLAPKQHTLTKFWQGNYPPINNFKTKKNMKTLNLAALKGLVTEYGSPLYPALPNVEAGFVSPGEYTIQDGNTLVIENDGNTMYIPIRTARLEAGVAEDQVFNIGIFKATRDAQGEYNGKPWSVVKDAEKVFAY